MGSLAQRLGLRAKILLLLADGLTPKDVSYQLQVSAPECDKSGPLPTLNPIV